MLDALVNALLKRFLLSLAAFGLVFGFGVSGNRISEPGRFRSCVRGLCPRGEWVVEVLALMPPYYCHHDQCAVHASLLCASLSLCLFFIFMCPPPPSTRMRFPMFPFLTQSFTVLRGG
jgi:hypothetical protein